MADSLHLIGIEHPRDLVEKDSFELYEKLYSKSEEIKKWNTDTQFRAVRGELIA